MEMKMEIGSETMAAVDGFFIFLSPVPGHDVPLYIWVSLMTASAQIVCS